MRKTERLDFKAFMRGEKVIIKETRKQQLTKTLIRAGAVSVVIVTASSLPSHSVSAAAQLISQAPLEGDTGAWDALINGLLGILDPVAKIFGLIAGIAIMTGNGKIGLERLLWLSLGYITARKVELWINFLNTI